jgi:phosphoribosylanthranilate isomerase
MTASPTRIKICGLTRPEDVDCALAHGVDALGFVLYEPSPRYVSLDRLGDLTQRLPAFVTPVLLFVNADAAAVQAACERVPAAWLQFHGDESPKRCVELSRQTGRPFIRAARIPIDATPRFDLVKFAQDYSTAQALLLDAQVEGYGGSGKTFDWSQLPPNVNAHLVLSGGLNAANVTAGIAHCRTLGRSLSVDVSSGVEAAKGIKDPDKIRAFVAAVRAADASVT